MSTQPAIADNAIMISNLSAVDSISLPRGNLTQFHTATPGCSIHSDAPLIYFWQFHCSLIYSRLFHILHPSTRLFLTIPSTPTLHSSTSGCPIHPSTTHIYSRLFQLYPHFISSLGSSIHFNSPHIYTRLHHPLYISTPNCIIHSTHLHPAVPSTIHIYALLYHTFTSGCTIHSLNILPTIPSTPQIYSRLFHPLHTSTPGYSIPPALPTSTPSLLLNQPPCSLTPAFPAAKTSHRLYCTAGTKTINL